MVINGYIPSLQVKDILGPIEQVPELADATRAGARVGVGAGSTEGQTKRIYGFFRDAHTHTHTPALYLIVHNIDAPALRDARTRTRTVLSTLALHPRIHLKLPHVSTRRRSCQARADTRGCFTT